VRVLILSSFACTIGEVFTHARRTLECPSRYPHSSGRRSCARCQPAARTWAIHTYQALIQAAEVPLLSAIDLQVFSEVEVIVFVHVCGLLLLRVGTQIDRFVPVQILLQLTKLFALNTDPATRANLVSMLELMIIAGCQSSPWYSDRRTHQVSPASDAYV
jgi:hypothetical protein